MAGAPPRTFASFSGQGTVNNWLRIGKRDTADRGQQQGTTEWLILGSVNRLYVLDLANLSLAHEAVTGPLLDSPLCNAELSSCIGPRDSIVETDTWNKVMLPLANQKNNNGTDTADDTLLVCGSTRQGECQLRRLPSLERVAQHPLLFGPWQHVSVAANAPDASSQALLLADRLFVAATSSHESSPYREAFPAVSTRLLSEGLQPVHAGSLDGEAAVHIRAEFRPRMRVHYLYTFHDQMFVYWLAVQPRSAHSTAQVTKLVRVCLEDDRYTSYSELELQCRSGEDNALFGVARAAIVWKEELWAAFQDADGQQSALCAFPLAKLRLTFWYNIDRCRGGTDNIGLAHIGRDAKCTNRSHLPLSEDTCLLGVGGAIEASAPALSLLPEGQLITALDVAQLDGHLLLAAGTERGRVLQMEVSGERNARRLRLYADFRAAADSIQRIAILGEQQRLLLAADKEVLLLRLSICAPSDSPSPTPPNAPVGSLLFPAAHIPNCPDCLAGGDPLCAWCLPIGRCVRARLCPSPLALLRQQCPRQIGPIRPLNLSLSGIPQQQQQQVRLSLTGLSPALLRQTELECVFGGGGGGLFSSGAIVVQKEEEAASANAVGNGNDDGAVTIGCSLPRERPRLPTLATSTTGDAEGGSSMRVSVGLRIRGTRAQLLIPAPELTLYSCSAHQLCSSCSGSRWPCRWCASRRRCVDIGDWGQQCPREGKQTVGCARILPSSLGGPDESALLLHDSAGANVSLEFPVENVPSGLALFCRIGGLQSAEPVLRPARLLAGGQRVQCAPGPLPLGGHGAAGSQPLRNLSLELMAGQEPVDATIVSVYKCALLAGDCSRCVALDPRFHCSWCESGCRHNDQCLGQPATGGAADELCTAPAIISFSPKSGPLEGGTRVEIVGRDLGSRLQDVQDRVRVAGVPCQVVDYQVSERIVCQTGKKTAPIGGPVRITIGRSGRRSVESPAGLGHFHYRSAQPQSVHPGFGPRSGGTRLNIFGQQLDLGSNASVHLDNLECQIQDRQPQQLSCLTAASARPYTVTAIRLQIDGAVRLIPGAKFDYRPDPVVKDVRPRAAFESGGRNLTVTGAHLDSLLAPKLFLLSPPTVPEASQDEWELVSELGPCRVLNASAMRCEAPRLALPTALLRQSQIASWTMGFAMDGVKAVRNMGSGMQLTTVPDPQFSPFPGVHLLQPEQPLMLGGQWLSQAAEPEDYRVSIGAQPCAVFLLEPDRLLCRPPAQQPAPTDDIGAEMADGRPLVVVRVGRNIRAEIGPVEYAGEGAQLSLLSPARLATLVLFALLALLLGLASIGLLWRRRQGEHERTYRRIQLQMEQMESQVRQECKKAFAELQTDVLAELDDCAIGLPTGGPLELAAGMMAVSPPPTTTASTTTTTGGSSAAIPLLDRREFLARLLLPPRAESAADQQSMLTSGYAAYSSQLPVTMAQFDTLLWNRQFLYVLVQMAEEEPAVSAAERTNLASLLLIVLSRNWAFATDVVLSLLSAHIQRCQHTRQAHLLFRHSDSLVEKLFQHWLTISLLPWLHDLHQGPAKPFFTLFKALKSLAEKGPVDAVTGHARYSLSEQSLLREPVDGRPLTLLVVPLDGFDQAPLQLRALDCDSIGQLKARLLDALYRNTAQSQRIGTDQFDLEWRCPRRGSVLLLDDDQPQQRAPRRLNTLAHYAVPDQALLAMQSRPATAGNQFTFRSGSSEHSLPFTLGRGWRTSSANHLLSGSSSSSSDSAGGHSPGNRHLGPAADETYFHLSAPTPAGINCGTAAKKRKGTASAAAAATQKRALLPEVYLTRLLMCKGTVQRFVDIFFDAVLFIGDGEHNNSPRPVPAVLKYVFDFLDAQAEQCQIMDKEVLHCWKSNCWVLRFWQQLLQNPDLLFDVPRQQCLAGSFAVLGQTLVDIFSQSQLDLSKESPSSKLLFAKEIARYRPSAHELFKRIGAQPAMPSAHFYDYAGSLSKLASDGLSSTAALNELLNWTKANGLRLLECLEADPEARRLHLGDRLRQIVQNSLLEQAKGPPPAPMEPLMSQLHEEHVYATLR